MTNTKDFSHHFLWLSVLFILGGAVINLPTKNADRLTFLGFLISFLLSILVFFATFKFDFLKYPILFLAVFFVSDTAVTFLKFIAKTLLNDKQNFWILLLFILPVLYFCTRKHHQILNFSLVAGIVCSALLVFFFFATFKDFNLKNIYIYSLPNIKNLFLQALPYIRSVTLPCAVLTLYAKQQKVKIHTALAGISLGNAMFLIGLFNSILLFGTTLAGELSYPYASAISTVTFGNLFSRLDGFSYFIYFAAAMIKITVCTNVIKEEIKKAVN